MNISRYKARGFVGIDADLITSLFDYGLIWKQYKRTHKGFLKGEYIFVFPVYNRDGVVVGIDWSSLLPRPLEDLFSWIDISDVAHYIGLTKDEFLSNPFHNQIYSLISYYGVENIL